MHMDEWREGNKRKVLERSKNRKVETIKKEGKKEGRTEGRTTMEEEDKELEDLPFVLPSLLLSLLLSFVSFLFDSFLPSSPWTRDRMRSISGSSGRWMGSFSQQCVIKFLITDIFSSFISGVISGRSIPFATPNMI